MKKIEAIIEPSDIEGMKEDLAGIGVGRMTVTEVHGFGRAGGPARVQRGVRFEPPYVTEAKVEIVVHDDIAAAVIGIMGQKAKTNESGQSDIRLVSLDDTANPAKGRKSAMAV
jgi:nitrogen regulatory protein PII